MDNSALRKTSLFLKALAQTSPISSPPAVTYLALDLEKRELDRTLSLIESSDLGPGLANRIRIGGLCGTYDDGIAYVRGGGLNDMHSSPSLTATSLQTASDPRLADDIEQFKDGQPASSKEDAGDEAVLSLNISMEGVSLNSELPANRLSSPLSRSEIQSTYYFTEYEETPPLHFLFLGSSIGNFTCQGAVEFLKSLPLRPWTQKMNPETTSTGAIGDTLLLGLDHDNEPDLIEKAYNDPAGHTRKFIMNGLAGVRRALQQGGIQEGSVAAFEDDKWDYDERYNKVESTSLLRSVDIYQHEAAMMATNQTRQIGMREVICQRFDKPLIWETIRLISRRARGFISNTLIRYAFYSIEIETSSAKVMTS